MKKVEFTINQLREWASECSGVKDWMKKNLPQDVKEVVFPPPKSQNFTITLRWDAEDGRYRLEGIPEFIYHRPGWWLNETGDFIEAALKVACYQADWSGDSKTLIQCLVAELGIDI